MVNRSIEIILISLSKRNDRIKMLCIECLSKSMYISDGSYRFSGTQYEEAVGTY